MLFYVMCEIDMQSYFEKNSTKTALIKIVNDLRSNMENKWPSVSVLLNLSAAFDAVDHKVLLDSLY